MATNYGDTVRLLNYPGEVYGIVKGRCRRDNSFLFVNVPGRGRIRIRGKHTKKVRNGEKTKT